MRDYIVFFDFMCFQFIMCCSCVINDDDDRYNDAIHLCYYDNEKS